MRPRIPAARAALLGGLALFAAADAAPATAQQLSTPADVARLQALTPACRDNPDAPWIGRVVGNYTGVFDRTMTISLIGCFETKAACDAWRARVSGPITGRLIQYGCTRRR